MREALAIAATGMNAQQTNVEVIANNIANVNTTGFKRARAEFTDLLYQAERLQGVPIRGGQNPIPEGAQIGLGVRTAAIRNLHQQGALAQTGNGSISRSTGRGWFQVTGADGETLYTRAGAFNTNANGEIVTLDGYVVEPTITVPSGHDRHRRQRVRAGLRARRHDNHAAAARPANARELRQRRRPRAARRQSLPGDDGVGQRR